MSRVVVVMGVSGSGKTTVGLLLAARLGWDFVDADDFHSPASKAKMAAGISLDDEDRRPWLRSLRGLIEERLGKDQPLVLACSALKEEYRELLGRADERVTFVYLRGSRELIARRLGSRSGHFMDPGLLASQFEALEEPEDAVVLDASLPPEELVSQAQLLLPAGSG